MGRNMSRPHLPVGLRTSVASFIALLAFAFAFQMVAGESAHAANVYEGYSKVGSVNSSYGGKYDIKSGYSKIGAKHSYGSKWNVYRGYSRVGYVQSSYGGKYNIYEGYSRVGYIRSSGSKWYVYRGYSKVGYVSGGPGAPAAAAGLLLLM